MATIAKLSNGSLLQIGDGGGSEIFTTVPEVKKLAGPGAKFDLLDVSSHDTPTLFREYIPGFSDGDSIRFTINWRPSNTVHKGIRIDAYAATLRNFKIVFPDTPFNTVKSSTYIQDFSPTADVGTEMTAAGMLKITGAPVWT
jgi:hypothetical protein